MSPLARGFLGALTMTATLVAAAPCVQPVTRGALARAVALAGASSLVVALAGVSDVRLLERDDLGWHSAASVTEPAWVHRRLHPYQPMMITPFSPGEASTGPEVNLPPPMIA